MFHIGLRCQSYSHDPIGRLKINMQVHGGITMPCNATKYRGTPEYDQIAQMLISTARRKSTEGYSPVYKIMGLVPGDHASGESGKLLGELSEETFAMGLPMLSAIVVAETVDNRPGRGFFPLAKCLKKVPM